MAKNEKDLDRPISMQVHSRGKKGNVTASNPYRLVVESGQQMYEVPPGSGKFYSADGTFIKELDAKAQKANEGLPMNQRQPDPKNAPQMDPDVKKQQESESGEDEANPSKAKDDHVPSREQAQQTIDSERGKHRQSNNPSKSVP